MSRQKALHSGSGGGGDDDTPPETLLPEEYHVYEENMPRGPSHGCEVVDGALTFDSETARRSVRDYRVFPPSSGALRAGALSVGAGGVTWQAVQLAWTCDLLSADVLKTLDPLKLSAAPASASASAMSKQSEAAADVPDARTLLNYSPEHGALRMWPEVYDKCIAEVSRLTWNESPERAAVLERLRARTSRLFTFAHRQGLCRLLVRLFVFVRLRAETLLDLIKA